MYQKQQQELLSLWRPTKDPMSSLWRKTETSTVIKRDTHSGGREGWKEMAKIRERERIGVGRWESLGRVGEKPQKNLLEETKGSCKSDTGRVPHNMPGSFGLPSFFTSFAFPSMHRHRGSSCKPPARPERASTTIRGGRRVTSSFHRHSPPPTTPPQTHYPGRQRTYCNSLSKVAQDHPLLSEHPLSFDVASLAKCLPLVFFPRPQSFSPFH